MYIHSYVCAITLIYYRMKTLCNKILSKTGNMNNRLSSVTIAMQAMCRNDFLCIYQRFIGEIKLQLQ